MHNFIIAIVRAATCFGYVKQPSSGCEYHKCEKACYISVALQIFVQG